MGTPDIFLKWAPVMWIIFVNNGLKDAKLPVWCRKTSYRSALTFAGGRWRIVFARRAAHDAVFPNQRVSVVTHVPDDLSIRRFGLKLPRASAIGHVGGFITRHDWGVRQTINHEVIATVGRWLAAMSFKSGVGSSIPIPVDVSLSKTLNPELLCVY